MQRPLSTVLKAVRKPCIRSGAKFRVDPAAIYLGGRIVIGEESTVEVGAGATLAGDILVADNSHVLIGPNTLVHDIKVQGAYSSIHIGADSTLKTPLIAGSHSQIDMGINTVIGRYWIAAGDHAIMRLGNGVILDSPEHDPAGCSIDHGTLVVADLAHLEASVAIRFGGTLRIGRYAGIGSGSEIMCHRRIDIGDYALISWNVSIYDTNGHSTDWRERRHIIEIGYPVGAVEENRPKSDVANRPVAEPVSIGNDVWIGKNAMITKGCIIGDRSILGMGTCVGAMVIDEDSVVVNQRPRVISKKPTSAATENVS